MDRGRRGLLHSPLLVAANQPPTQSPSAGVGELAKHPACEGLGHDHHDARVSHTPTSTICDTGTHTDHAVLAGQLESHGASLALRLGGEGAMAHWLRP
jgi:hypothetical protein